MRFSDWGSIDPRFVESIAYTRAIEEARKGFLLPGTLPESAALAAAQAETFAARSLVFTPASFATLQEAFTAAAAANGVLQLTPGATYAITSPITVSVGAFFKIEGCGARFLSTIVDDGSGKDAIKLTGSSTSKIVLDDFSLDHTYVSGDSLAGLRVDVSVLSVSARNVFVSGFPYYGIDSTAGQQTWVNCRSNSNRHAGAALSGSGTIAALNFECSSNGVGNNSEGYGLLISGGNTVVLGGRYLSNDRYGIDLRRANNAFVFGPYVYNSGYIGIYGVNEDSEKDASNLKIMGATVDMNNRVGSEHAIWVGAFAASGTAHFDEAIVSHNTIKNGLSKGVYVSSGAGAFTAKKVEVSDNQMEQVTGAAVEIGGTAVVKDAIASRNILRNTGNIVFTSVENVVSQGNIRTLTSGNASNFIACTADLFTVLTGNISNATYTGKPFTWAATRSVVKDNLAIYDAQVRELIASKAAIPDNTATTFMNIVVPNIEIGGTFFVDYVVVDEDKGDRYYTGRLIVQVVRYPGVAAQVSIAHAVAQQSLSTASGFGRTSTVAFSSAVSGAVGAANTVALKVTSDQSDNLTSFMSYHAELLHAGKIGGAVDMTLAAA